MSEKSMHAHSFKEITEYFNDENLGYPKDEILHIFECSCGFTLIEKKKPFKSSFHKKKMTIYTVIRKPTHHSQKSSHRSKFNDETRGYKV